MVKETDALKDQSDQTYLGSSMQAVCDFDERNETDRGLYCLEGAPKSIIEHLRGVFLGLVVQIKNAPYAEGLDKVMLEISKMTKEEREEVRKLMIEWIFAMRTRIADDSNEHAFPPAEELLGQNLLIMFVLNCEVTDPV